MNDNPADTPVIEFVVEIIFPRYVSQMRYYFAEWIIQTAFKSSMSLMLPIYTFFDLIL